jgi:hypothetical protein
MAAQQIAIVGGFVFPLTWAPALPKCLSRYMYKVPTVQVRIEPNADGTFTSA